MKNNDRDISWKRFISDSNEIQPGVIRNSILNSVIKGIIQGRNNGNTTNDALNSILTYSYNILNWRKYFVESDTIWKYMSEDKFIRIYDGNDNEIYLLSKSQMNGEHVELRTYQLFDKINNVPVSWKKRYESANVTGKLPYIKFENQNNAFMIDIYWDITKGRGYYLQLYTRDESQIPTLVAPIVSNKQNWGLNLSDSNSRYQSDFKTEEGIIDLAKSIMQSI